MNGIEQLTQKLFKKESIEECSLHELQSLTRQYPYFAAGHLLLAEKIRTLDSSLYNNQLTKASLYFYNPLWLDFILNKETYSAETERKDEAATEVMPEQHTDKNADELIPTSAIEDKTSLNTETQTEELQPETAIENVAEETVAEPAIYTEEEFIPLVENGKEDYAEIETTHEKEAEPAEAGLVNNLVNIAEEEPAFQQEEISSSQSEKEEPAETKKQEEEYADVVHASSEDDKDTEEKLPELKIEPVPDTKNDLLFEPYHTVDYFASQGIKVEQNEKPTDRFGLQLKSFTEWLKMMKRLPEKELSKKISTAFEKKVETMARHSLAEKDVITEAMAEVWLKQGNDEKAIEVYNKLSLLNPSKSSYFAAKIEHLKSN